MIVKLITCPAIDWTGYIKECTNAINRSPTRALDKAGIKVGDHNSFLLSLVNLIDQDAWLNCSNAPEVISHLSFTFLISLPGDLYIRFIKSTARILNISVVDSNVDYQKTMIVSGTLDQWRTAIDICAIKDLAKLAAALIEIFIRLGLRETLKINLFRDIDQIIIEG